MFIQRNYMMCNSLNRINLRLITFGYARLEESLRRAVSGCPFSRLYLILKGSMYVKTAEGDMVELIEGDGYLVPAGAKIEYICIDPVEYLFFHIKWSGFDELDLLRRCKNTLCHLGKVDWMQAALQLIQKESQNPADGIWLKNEIDSLVLDCVEVYGIDLQEPNYSECTKRGIRYIKENLSADFNVDDVAEQALVARSTITRFFHNEVHLSITDYVYELLWTEACRLLNNGNLSVLKISEELGFSEQGFFSRQFNDRLKIRPGQFRSQPLI